MSRFLLTAQLQLRAPTNTRQVMNTLRSQLAGVNVPVQMQGVAQAQKQLKGVAKEAKVATTAAQNMGKSFGLAFKRFAAFTVASRAVSLFTNGLANAVDEAIDFQREMVKISQVTGQAVQQLKGLEDTISSLSKSLGVNSKELLSTARILAQTGLRARELEVALEALAKTTLAPTFDDITKTAEGAVAILAQFGGGVGKLEQQLGSINAVAGKFAVESGDLIGAIRRVGGVFVEAGGSLEDLLGLFTSIRATTRESAESIATGLRTIFTRIQRPRTIEFLKQFGVELETAEGKFVGAFEAVRRLNKAIGSLDQGDITFVRIAEEVAGFRQIGKVIPLLKQFELAERSRQAAIEGGDSLTKDAAAAQQALAVQIIKVKEEFMALVRGIANTTAFQVMVKGSLALASALIRIGEAIKPIIPLLGALAAFKFAKGLGSFAAGFGSSLRGVTGKNQGGKILGFNRGGYVPGTGNRDTVPAMLQPGEFVIKASSAKKLGPQALNSMNNNRYAKGGIVMLDMKPNKVGGLFMQPDAEDKNITSTSGSKFIGAEKEAIIAAISGGGLKTARKMGDDGKPITRQQAEKQATTTSSGMPKGAYGEHVQRKLGAASSGGMKAKFGKLSASKQASLRSGFIDTRMGGQELGAGTGVADAADSIKLRAAGSAIRAHLASTKDLNSGLGPEVSRIAEEGFQSMTRSIVNSKELTNNVGPERLVGKKAEKNIGNSVRRLFAEDGKKENSAKGAIEGYIFEAVIGAISGVLPESSGANFDFENLGRGSAEDWADLFGPASGSLITQLLGADAKRTANAGQYKSIIDKTKTFLASRAGMLKDLVNVDLTRANKGGSIGGQGDTVPALLTPGEFVINKESARNIGYGNLNSMNKSGVSRFNKGGFVGWKRYNSGGQASGGMMGNMGLMMAMPMLTASMVEMTKASDGSATAMTRLAQYVQQVGVTFVAIKVAMEAFGFSLKAKNIATFFGTGPAGLGGILKSGAKSLKEGLAGASFGTVKGKDGTERSVFRQKGKFAAASGSAAGQQRLVGRKLSKTAGGKQRFNPDGSKKYDDVFEDVFQGGTGNMMKGITNFGNKLGKGKARLGAGLGRAKEGFASAGGSQIASGAKDIFGSLNDGFKTMMTKMSGIMTNVMSGLQSKLASAGQKLGGVLTSVKDSLVSFAGKGLNLAKAGFSKLGGAFPNLTKGLQQTAQKAILLAATYVPNIAALVANTKALFANSIARVKDSFSGLGGKMKGFGSKMKGSRVGQGIGKGFSKFKGSKIGGGLGKIGKGIGGLASRGVGMVSGMFGGGAAAAGGAAAGGGLLAGAGAALSTIAGPAAAVALALGLVSGGLSAMFDAQGKYEAAVRNGSEAEAQKYAVMKNVPGLVQLFGSGASEAYQGLKAAFGGDSIEKLKAQASAAVLVAQFDKEKADISRKSADALRDLKSGATTASKAMEAVTKGFKKQAEISRAEKKVRETREAEKSTGAGAFGRNTAAFFTFGFVDSASEKNEKIDKENDESLQKSKEEMAQAFEGIRSSTVPLQKKFILSGQSFDDFLDASGLAGDLTAEQTQRLRTDYEQQQKAIQQNIKFIEALNFGLRDAAGSAQAMSVTMDGIAKSQEAGFNSFSQSASVLEAAMTSAGKNISGAQLDQAIGDLESSMRSFGASEEEINKATGTVKGVQQAQANTDSALEAAKTALIEGGADTSDAAIKDALGTELLKGVEGPAKERLKASIDNLKIDEEVRSQIRAGDLSGILSKTLDPVSDAVTKQAIDLAKKRADIENKIIDATKKRQQAELQFIAAQKKAIDIQLEAGKIFEEFGGAKLSTDQQLQARRGQANLDLENAGIGGLTGGGAGDIRRAAADVERKFRGQQDAVNFGTFGMARNAEAGGQPIGPAFAGAQGVEDDKRDELKQANQALLDFTKNRINLLKEELSIVQQKNAAEKKSLQSLLSGDIESFIQGQAASAAGAVLRSGDAGLASTMSASALGAGFATLEGQGLSDRQMNRAAGLSLGSVGISDPRAASVLSGTTAEEQRLKSEGRELAGVMGDLGQQTADMSKMEVNAATVVLTAQKLQLDGGAATGLAAGGMVYASRGMFIPRGTDTVPAMLTPGEFVVNRSAVQRGNNLSILRSMNGSMGAPGGGMGMAAGGMVYMAQGGLLSRILAPHKAAMGMMGKVGGFALNNSPMGMASKALGGGDLTDVIGKAVAPLTDTMQTQIDKLKDTFENSPLGSIMQQFSDGANKLVDSALSLKVDPTNVNVNFGGLSFLEMLREDAVKSIMDQVQDQISGTKFNEVGDAVRRTSGLS